MKTDSPSCVLLRCLRYPEKEKSQEIGLGKYLARNEPDWQAIVEYADKHFVIPLLYYNLQQRGFLWYLPEELANLIREIYHLNVLRNDRIRKEIIRLIPLFNSADIEPIFLKGSAALLMNLYGDNGLRAMNDVDFLVSREQRTVCVKLMKSKGYREMEGVNISEDFYHEKPLVHEDHSIRFEIHDRLHSKIEALGSTDIIQRSHVCQLEGEGRVRVPDYNHFAVHNILHHQVFDDGYFQENVPLYQLCDLYMLREKYDQFLDWKRIGERFALHSLQDHYHQTFHEIKRCFNQSPPEEIGFLPIKVLSIRFRKGVWHILNRWCTPFWREKISQGYNRLFRFRFPPPFGGAGH